MKNDNSIYRIQLSVNRSSWGRRGNELKMTALLKNDLSTNLSIYDI